jgi:hypothetical protein
MKRQLHEAKADLDLAVVKSLDRAPLTFTELKELRDLGVRDLMFDHDLDYVLAEKVLNHVKHECLRLQAQNQQTPIEGFESDFSSLTRSTPTAQKPLNLSESKLRKIIKQVLMEELSG